MMSLALRRKFKKLRFQVTADNLSTEVKRCITRSISLQDCFSRRPRIQRKFVMGAFGSAEDTRRPLVPSSSDLALVLDGSIAIQARNPTSTPASSSSFFKQHQNQLRSAQLLGYVEAPKFAPDDDCGVIRRADAQASQQRLSFQLLGSLRQLERLGGFSFWQPHGLRHGTADGIFLSRDLELSAGHSDEERLEQASTSLIT
jgi:hypothetical protein